MEPGQEPGATAVPEKVGGSLAPGPGGGGGDQGDRVPHAVKVLRFARGRRVVKGDLSVHGFLSTDTQLHPERSAHHRLENVLVP